MEDNIQVDDEQPLNPPEPSEPIQETPPEPSKPLSIKEAVRDAFARQKERVRDAGERARDASGKFVAGADKEATPTPDKPVSEPKEPTPDTAKPKGAPQRLSPEIKAMWESLPPSVQAEFQKIDADTSKGFDKFKAQYQEYDQILEPLKPAMQRMGLRPAQILQRALGYATALAGPDRLRAAQQLLRDFGIDPTAIAGIQPQQAAGAQPQYIPPEFSQYLQNIAQRVDTFEQHFNAQQQNSWAAWITNWAKDKPHYEAVRREMGKDIAAGKFVDEQTGQPDLQAAYEAACWANPEIRALLQHEQQQKFVAAQKQNVQHARRASQSLPSSSPGVPPKPNGQLNKVESVSESIKRALRELTA